MIVAGASAYPRLIDYERMASIAEESSAYLMADMAHIAGLVAARVIPSPVPFCDFVTFTTYKTLMGGRGGVILCRKRFADRLDRTVFPGSQGTPSMSQLAAKAVCFKLAAENTFVECQKKILANAVCFAEAFSGRGYRVVTGGTDNHLVLIDLRNKKLGGDAAETLLESVGIVVNRNVIPYDTASISAPSGIRIGTTSISARGMGPAEVVQIVDLIHAVLSAPGDTAVRLSAADAVAGLCRRFPAGMI
jgi:glycine hydroxymethyltransferase